MGGGMILLANPYLHCTWLEFLCLFVQRMFQFLIGQLPLKELASDEIQVLVLSLIAIASGLVGTFLVLKKMTMLANSLSHTLLLGLVAVYLLSAFVLTPEKGGAYSISIQMLFFAALVTAVLNCALTHVLTHYLDVQEDASIGLVFTTLFGLGVVLATIFTRNTHLGVEAVMGNIDALHPHDLKMAFWVTVVDCIVITWVYKEFKMIAFDPGFATSLGYSRTTFDGLLLLLTSATVIGAFRAVGVLLVLAFLVGPVLIARLITHRLKSLLILSIVIGVGISLFGVALSRHLFSIYHLPISTSGLIVTLMGVIYFSLFIFKIRMKRTA